MRRQSYQRTCYLSDVKVRYDTSPWIRRLSAAASIVLLASCTGDSGPGTVVEPAGVATVSISPATAALFVGKTQQLTATPMDAQGRAISGKSVNWSSSNTASATITSDGLVTAVTFGSATVTATVDGVSATALVKVLHDPIVFMPGFQSSGAIWTTMIDRLKADGWTDAPLVTWTYDSNQ